MSQTTAKFEGSHSAGEFLLDLENMRANIEQSARIIADLKLEIEGSRRHHHGQIPSEDLKVQLRQKELAVAQQRARLDDLNDNLKIRSTIFSENQAYHDGLMEELKQLNTEFHRLQTESRTFEEAAKETEYLTRRLEEAREQRNRMQREFDSLQKQPFFKRESDQTSF